ncbi:MAG: hypothetical protein ACI9FJ_002044 [Alteromonadaceae bacterium]|jgi:hypothetical protein
MDSKFRQNKYRNESGNQKGNWFINRLDYFQFHYYPRYNLHRVIASIATVGGYVGGLKYFNQSFLIALLCWYVCYLGGLTSYLLKRRICRYRGYLFYPRRFTAFFNSISKDIDANDFDTIATQNNHLDR